LLSAHKELAMPPHPAAEIRSAIPQDADMIREVVRAAYAKWVPLIGREPLPMKADYQRAVREHPIAILHVGGKMVGLIEMILQPDHLWIENVAVMPENQGRGMGRQLLAHADRIAAEAGRAEIRLLTNAAFEANIALYKRVGYAIERQEPFMGGVAVFMSKTLCG
jgi:ribosomal protein S18 acetylase RimI-like enzyme